MLRNFDRDDIETLWKLVKAKYGYTKPEDIMDRVLAEHLKNIFEPNRFDEVWGQQYRENVRVTLWRLYNFCGVHLVLVGGVQIYMLADKDKYYPLNPSVVVQLLDPNKVRLKVDKWDEMTYQLLKKMERILEPKEKKRKQSVWKHPLSGD